MITPLILILTAEIKRSKGYLKYIASTTFPIIDTCMFSPAWIHTKLDLLERKTYMKL